MHHDASRNVAPDERLKVCKEAWEAGHVLAIAEAVALVHLHQMPIPHWLTCALIQSVVKRCTRQERKFYRLSYVHLIRYIIVECFRSIGRKEWWHHRKDDAPDALSWEQAWEQASEHLKGSFAAGSPPTIKNSYDLVRKAEKKGQHAGRYFLYRDLDLG